MTSKGQSSRADSAELKALIYQKVGNERADRYFKLLNLRFNSKISKSDFNKLCFQTLGKEHFSLNNRFILSILDNAAVAKVPPPNVTKASNSPNVKLPSGYKKKTRSLVSRDRKFRERPSPLGPLGKTRSPTLDQSPTEFNSRGSRPRVASVEDGEEVEQVGARTCAERRSFLHITAPLGVSLDNSGGSRKKNISKDLDDHFQRLTCQSSCELPNTTSLRGQLEHKLLSHGIGISEDCVNLLNNGLDVYLKRLIEPGMGLTRSRFGFCGNLPGRREQKPGPSACMSMSDFCVSIQSNPQILGEDWPIELEKVCSHASVKH